MSALLHDPADVVRRLMIALGLGTDPPDGEWPVYSPAEPANPDAVISVKGTAGRDVLRDGITGERVEMFGVQIMVRAATNAAAYPKASAIAAALDAVSWDTVTLDGTAYTVDHLIRTSGPLPLGHEQNSKRSRVSLNYLAWVLRS